MTIVLSIAIAVLGLLAGWVKCVGDPKPETWIYRRWCGAHLSRLEPAGWVIMTIIVGITVVLVWTQEAENAAREKRAQELLVGVTATLWEVNTLAIVEGMERQLDVAERKISLLPVTPIEVVYKDGLSAEDAKVDVKRRLGVLGELRHVTRELLDQPEMSDTLKRIREGEKRPPLLNDKERRQRVEATLVRVERHERAVATLVGGTPEVAECRKAAAESEALREEIHRDMRDLLEWKRGITWLVRAAVRLNSSRPTVLSVLDRGR